MHGVSVATDDKGDNGQHHTDKSEWAASLHTHTLLKWDWAGVLLTASSVEGRDDVTGDGAWCFCDTK